MHFAQKNGWKYTVAKATSKYVVEPGTFNYVQNFLPKKVTNTKAAALNAFCVSSSCNSSLFCCNAQFLSNSRSAQSRHSFSCRAVHTHLCCYRILYTSIFSSAYLSIPLHTDHWSWSSCAFVVCFAVVQTMERVREQGIKKNVVFKNSAYGASHWFPPIKYNGVGLVSFMYLDLSGFTSGQFMMSEVHVEFADYNFHSRDTCCWIIKWSKEQMVSSRWLLFITFSV